MDLKEYKMSAKFLKNYIRDVMKYKGIMKGTYTA